MQRLKIKDQIQLTNILEKAIKRFNIDLDEVDESERRFGGCGDYNEVEGCVVAVGYEGRDVVVF
jgi:hypothetical protein